MLSRDVCHRCRTAAESGASDIRRNKHLYVRWVCTHSISLVYEALEQPPADCTHMLEHAMFAATNCQR